MEPGCGRVWAEINLDHIMHNLSEVRRLIGNKTRIMAVVKANAYGHGAAKVAGALQECGVKRLAVATLDEAIQLRSGGCMASIQVLGHTFPERAEEILTYDLTQTVFNFEPANALSYWAGKIGKPAKVHIKVNTGMNRVGFKVCEATVHTILKMSKLPFLEIEGIMTHFASADEEDSTATVAQFEKFMYFCRELEKAGVYIPIKHASNSAALIKYPEMGLDMVRPGIMLYGIYPSAHIDREFIGLKPAMSLKANVISVNNVCGNEYLSYGRKYKTHKMSRIATIAVGYADGYPRLLSNNGRVIVKESFAPVVGTVCMDSCLIDVTDGNCGVAVGDESVLMGRMGVKEITAEELAEWAGTIPYEVVCRIGMRVPRVYIRHGKVNEADNYLRSQYANM